MKYSFFLALFFITGCSIPKLNQNLSWLYVTYKLNNCSESKNIKSEDFFSDSHGNEIKFGYNIKKENRKVHIYRINRDSFLGAQTLWQTIRIEPTKDCYYTFSALVSNDVSYSNPTNTCSDVSDDKCLEKLGKTGDKIKVSSRMFLEKAKSGYFIIYTNLDNVKIRN